MHIGMRMGMRMRMCMRMRMRIRMHMRMHMRMCIIVHYNIQGGSLKYASVLTRKKPKLLAVCLSDTNMLL